MKNSPREDNWAMGCHLSALAGLVIPFGNILGPLVVWLVKREEMKRVAEAGKEALNFQISMTIYLLVASLLCFVLVGFVLLPVLALADLVLTIVAGVKAGQGEDYRYPFTFRLVG